MAGILAREVPPLRARSAAKCKRCVLKRRWLIVVAWGRFTATRGKIMRWRRLGRLLSGCDNGVEIGEWRSEIGRYGV